MGWTDEQKSAIELRNQNILVSAAAGSGKTAVLVERIRRLVVDENTDIDRMLIVTFTNAAAAEMKAKIRSALIKEAMEKPEKADSIRKQLFALQTADISTFHAFAQKVVRRFFYLVDTEPGFTVSDDTENALLAEEALDHLFEEEFERMDEDFRDFMNAYSSDRNFTTVRKMIKKTHEAVRAMPYPDTWLNESIDALHLDMEGFENSPVFIRYRNHILDQLDEADKLYKKALLELSDAGLNNLYEKLHGEAVQPSLFKEEIEKDGSLNNIKAVLTRFNPVPRLAASGDEKELYKVIKPSVTGPRDNAKEIMKKLEKKLTLFTTQEEVEHINRTGDFAETLARLLRRYDELYSAEKKKKKTLDFNDLEHLALEILQHEEAKDYYKNRFNYIFIDEYQDTSSLQEEIIGKIKRNNNLFMVGDIKQSIYRFRLADPSIFKERYQVYSKGDTPDSTLVNLNANFRSKDAILNYINSVFKNKMENYDDKAALHPGLPYDGPYRFKPEYHIVNCDLPDAYHTDELILDMKKNNFEALHALEIAKSLIGTPYMDSKENREKLIEPGDIVILNRSVKNCAEAYTEIFKHGGLDLLVQETEGFLGSLEIEIFMNLLSVIDNKRQDVKLISSLHSSIFGFTADELSGIRLCQKKGSFYDAFVKCAKKGENENLSKKCSDTLEQLVKWREEAGLMSLSKFLWKLMTETGYYIIAGSIPGGKKRQANLNILIDKARDFEEKKGGSLESFLRYIDIIKEKKIDLGQSETAGDAEKAVKLMTIHHSKGLEFPVVIVTGMTTKIKYRAPIDNVRTDKDLGLAMTLPNFDTGLKIKPITWTILEEKAKKEDAAEALRVLYVAMTRAKERLYLIGSVDNKENYEKNFKDGVVENTSYGKMICDEFPGVLVGPSQNTLELLTENNAVDKVMPDLLEPSDSEKKRVREILDFSYPHEDDRHFKSKYSVSELNKMKNSENDEVYSPTLFTPGFKRKKKKLTPSEAGTIYHGIMERLDFSRCDNREFIISSIEEMERKNIFTEEEVNAVDLEMVFRFFETNLGKRACKAAKKGLLKKEKPFTMMAETDMRKIPVQGVIDCYFIEDGEIVLLDYKTSYVNLSSPREQELKRIEDSYKKQLVLYSEAIEKGTKMNVKERYLYLSQTADCILV